MKPLVSIIIPAYNAEETIGEAIRSAVAQTWEPKEIIVVDDGSTDRTAEIARRFEPYVSVFSTENRGLSAAVNYGCKLCKGDYVQELDADDILVADKIERQLAAISPGDSKRVLLSSPWAYFFYRTCKGRFISSALCESLSPAEWLFRKLNYNLHMQNATWLVSRELMEAAGPWNEELAYDQDGEYFARIIVASEGVRFVPGPAVFYRLRGGKRISYVGRSQRKKESLFASMKLHIGYLRSLEESDRVRKACVIYMQNWYRNFYPDCTKIMTELQDLAANLGGHLKKPRISWKYAWIIPVLGYDCAARAQELLPELKTKCLRDWDRVVYRLETQVGWRRMREERTAARKNQAADIDR